MADTPIKPGYYWAKWRIPAEGTYEGELLCPSDNWEIVEVWPTRNDFFCDTAAGPVRYG